MVIHDSIADCIGKTPLVRLRRLFPDHGTEVLAKLELLNPGGSVKDRPARQIVIAGLSDGTFTSRTHLLESSSGNFGIALAMMAKLYGLRFTCVVDPKTTPANLRMLELLDAELDMVHERDDQGGYLKTRITRVQQLLGTIPNSRWVNQYANDRNWQAHYRGTGTEIVEQCPQGIDALVLAVSTTGTILGVARRVRETFPGVHIVAVDAVGSVLFGGPAGPREIPGIGSSRIPEMMRRDEIDEVVYISDLELIGGCRELLKTEGIFAGGSSGAVVAGIRKILPSMTGCKRIVTILPDRGERYMDMIYDDAWIRRTCSSNAEQHLAIAQA